MGPIGTPRGTSEKLTTVDLLYSDRTALFGPKIDLFIKNYDRKYQLLLSLFIGCLLKIEEQKYCYNMLKISSEGLFYNLSFKIKLVKNYCAFSEKSRENIKIVLNFSYEINPKILKIGFYSLLWTICIYL